MAETKFIRFVRLCNALAITTSGLFVLSLICFALISQVTRKVEPEKPDILAERSPEAENESEPKLKMDRYLEVRGTPYLIFPLESGETYRRDSYLDSSSSGSKATYRLSRNYLFVNSKNEGQQWLLPDNKNLIISDRPIPNSADKTLPTQAILYTLVTQDTDVLSDPTLIYQNK